MNQKALGVFYEIDLFPESKKRNTPLLIDKTGRKTSRAKQLLVSTVTKISALNIC